MELNIIKAIKDTLRTIRRAKHKAMPILKKKIVKKTKPIVKKREQIKTIVDGRELSLKNIAEQYNLDLRTVKARYKVGNRGKLLCRPTPVKKKAT